MPKSRVTIRDVAKKANVSHQTVSRVINGNKQVRPETRAKVEAAIKKLGYRPNVVAQAMANGCTNTLACITPNLTDYAFAYMIEGAQREAYRQGYFLLSATAPDLQTFDTLIDQLVVSGRTDGVIVTAPYRDERYTRLRPEFPTVLAGARLRENSAEKFSFVVLNDYQTAYDATKHLCDLAHRRIGMITGPVTEDCTKERSRGFRAAMSAGQRPLTEAYILEGDWSAESAYDAFQRLVEQTPLPTALFVQNDAMAMGVLRAAREQNIKIPDQLAIVSIDNMPIAAYSSPPLSTFKQDFELIGREAARLLITAVQKNEMVRQVLVSAEFHPRQSSQLYTSV